MVNRTLTPLRECVRWGAAHRSRLLPRAASHRLGFSPRRAYLTVMACLVCDNTGRVCENHPDRPWRGDSQRGDACDCGAGMPCQLCNPCGGIDEPPAKIGMAEVTADARKRH